MPCRPRGRIGSGSLQPFHLAGRSRRPTSERRRRHAPPTPAFGGRLAEHFLVGRLLEAHEQSAPSPERGCPQVARRSEQELEQIVSGRPDRRSTWTTRLPFATYISSTSASTLRACTPLIVCFLASTCVFVVMPRFARNPCVLPQVCQTLR